MSDVPVTRPCASCGCVPCMCAVPGFVTYRGYTLAQALASVGPGWAGLVQKLWAAKPADVTVTQVKEKYGTLRWYTGAAPEGYLDLVDVVEAESATICEECGAAGRVDWVRGWARTRCDRCLDKFLGDLAEGER